MSLDSSLSKKESIVTCLLFFWLIIKLYHYYYYVELNYIIVYITLLRSIIVDIIWSYYAITLYLELFFIILYFLFRSPISFTFTFYIFFDLVLHLFFISFVLLYLLSFLVLFIPSNLLSKKYALKTNSFSSRRIWKNVLIFFRLLLSKITCFEFYLK